MEIEGLIGKLRDSLGSLRRNTNSYGKSLRLTIRSISELRNERHFAVLRLFLSFPALQSKNSLILIDITRH